MIDDTTHLLWVEDWLEVNVVMNSGDVKRDNYSLIYQVCCDTHHEQSSKLKRGPVAWGRADTVNQAAKDFLITI